MLYGIVSSFSQRREAYPSRAQNRCSACCHHQFRTISTGEVPSFGFTSFNLQYFLQISTRQLSQDRLHGGPHPLTLTGMFQSTPFLDLVPTAHWSITSSTPKLSIRWSRQLQLVLILFGAVMVQTQPR